jgi:hypothetical protein
VIKYTAAVQRMHALPEATLVDSAKTNTALRHSSVGLSE